MLQYFRPLKFDDYTLSIDNVVCDYLLHERQKDGFIALLENITFEYCCELTHWDSYKIGTFRMQFTIDLRDGNSFWIGCGINKGKVNYGRIRMEYNPNKVAHHDCFRKILAFLNTCCRQLHTHITRYDLAIDFPILRENAFLVKDRRKRILYDDGISNRTEYLGSRSTVNSCKLYNKQIESALSYPLTRLELTLSPEQKYEDINFPEVYFIRDLQMVFDELKLTDTDRFILGALLQGYGDINQLGRKTREKMERIMKPYVDWFILERSHYEKIRGQLKDFLNYPTTPLDGKELDTDYMEPYRIPFNVNDWEEIDGINPFDKNEDM